MVLEQEGRHNPYRESPRRAALRPDGTVNPVLIYKGDPLAVRGGMYQHANLGVSAWLTTVRDILLLLSSSLACTVVWVTVNVLKQVY